jgi:flagella basal body P-ring formation protein FlgA
VVDLGQLQSMLARRGVNLSNWVFRGASRCTVQRVGRAPPASPAQNSDPLSKRSTTANAVRPNEPSASPTIISADQQQPTTQPAAGTEASRATVCDPNSLEAVLRAHLSRRLSELGGTPVIRFSPGAARVLSLCSPTYTFRITDRSDRLLGMVPMEILVLDRGQPRQSLPVIADVSLRKTVIIASRPINRGEIIRSEHLLSEDRNFDRVDDIGVSRTAMLVGQRAKRFIDNHAVLSMRDVEQMPLVLANDLVTVFVRRGGLSIRSSAKALSAGGLGDTVQLRNEMSREVFAAVVTGQKSVEVGDGPRAFKSADAPAPAAAVAHNFEFREEGR